MKYAILVLVLLGGCGYSKHLTHEAVILLRDPHQGRPIWENNRRVFLEDCAREGIDVEKLGKEESGE